MRAHHVLLPLLCAALLVGVTSPATLAHDGDDKEQETRLRARLTGYEEVPAVSTAASGLLRASTAGDDSSLTYELSFADLQGIVTQSHIHLGQLSVNGGVMVFLCGTTTAPGPAGTPTCPAAPGGTVSRAVTAADVLGPAGQGVAAGEFAEFLAAIRRGVAYANVHSSVWPGGEIRGQIHVR